MIMPKVLHDIAEKALHLQGSLGITTQAPFTDALINSYHVGLNRRSYRSSQSHGSP